jgi:hypothetical protein
MDRRRHRRLAKVLHWPPGHEYLQCPRCRQSPESSCALTSSPERRPRSPKPLSNSAAPMFPSPPDPGLRDFGSLPLHALSKCQSLEIAGAGPAGLDDADTNIAFYYRRLLFFSGVLLSDPIQVRKKILFTVLRKSIGWLGCNTLRTRPTWRCRWLADFGFI